MPPQCRPHCGYCCKEFSKLKDVQLHISNAPKCQAARNHDWEGKQETVLTDLEMQQVVESVEPTDQQYEDQPEYEPTHCWTDHKTEQFNDHWQPQSLLAEGSGTQDDGAETASSPGCYAEDVENVVHTFWTGCTAFERLREEQASAIFADKLWMPFKDMEEWELAQFLTKELMQTAIDTYLKLPIEWTQSKPRHDTYCSINEIRQTTAHSQADILQGCHLAPKFGTTPVEQSWTPLNVLDNAEEFFLNHYIDFHLFETSEIHDFA
jgi:hypothetical protein